MKPNNCFFMLMIMISALLSSCAKVFYAPDAYSLASAHRSVAIMPPSVSIAPNKKITAEALVEMQYSESLSFQNEIYSWLLKRKMQGKIKPEIQDVQTTNSLLKQAGYPEKTYTPDQICEILNVDGLMNSNFSLSKPISTGAAIALAVVVGVYGPTNTVSVSMNIRDCANRKDIWNYDHQFSGSIGSTPENLVDALMRNASKKMPYMK
jgi:hypothetical protein